MLKTLMAYLLSCGAIATAWYLGNRSVGPLAVLDFHSMVGVTMAGLLGLCNFRLKELRQTLALFLTKQEAGLKQLAMGLQLIRTQWRYQLNTMFFLWLTALMITLLTGGDMNSVGHLVALMLISLLYLMLLKFFVLMPIEDRLSKRQLLLRAQDA